MNSEELELSLRTEFESYLKEVFVEMRQEFTQLQEIVESNLEKQKSQLDEVFSEVLGRLEKGKEFDAGFKDTVLEHLRLAKDEGAKITAAAFAQAEEFDRSVAPASEPAFGIKEIHEAVKAISEKTSQSEILKTLVHHATYFAPRGAFFIVKNEHLVGWRVFGKEKGEAEERVREVFLPASANSLLGESVKTLKTAESDSGYYSDDAEIFKKLGFNAPQKMFALPLVARGRGVAVLYADGGDENAPVNVEALETLIQVAGLTVEVLAATKAHSSKKISTAKTSDVHFEDEVESFKAEEESKPVEAFEPSPSYQSVVSESVIETSYQTSIKTESFTAPQFEFVADAAQEEVVAPAVEKFPEFETSGSWPEAVGAVEITTQNFSAQEFAENFAKETDPAEYAKDFSYQPSVQTNDFDLEPAVVEETVETEAFAPTEEFVPTKEQTYGTFDAAPEKEETVERVSQPISTAPTRSRLSERNVDLPIEVTEDERRLHNDARRFARLLVSEIKLYNEQKVKEGRESSDLYERLKEAIDRSREMYDKRVQPPVAAKFDYFHYELVNALAEGDDNKLGKHYPGSVV